MSGALKKGFIKNRVTGEVLNFYCNPHTINKSRSVEYGELGGGGSPFPLYEYLKGGGEDLSFDLHTFESTTVTKNYIKFFEDIMPPKDTRGLFKVPPTAYISFGSICARVILVGYSETHEDFNINLETIQASFSLTFKVVV